MSDPFAPADPAQRAVAARNMPRWFAQLMHDGDTLRSTADVAGELGINPSRVRQLAREHRLGYPTAGGRVFSGEDVEFLRRRKTSRGRGRADATTPSDDVASDTP